MTDRLGRRGPAICAGCREKDAEIERLKAEQSPPIDRSVLVRWYRYDPAFHHLVDSLVVERLATAKGEK